MNILFLGSGTSTGVPVIGCDCRVCCEARRPGSRQARLRSSVLVQTAQTTLLVDSGPDLRQQALRYGLTAIDAVVYTHQHLDHVAGFDELRAFCWHRDSPLPMYAGPQTLAQLRQMYAWAFAPSNTWKGYVHPDAHDHGGKPFVVGDVEVCPVPVVHGRVETFGYVFRSGGRSFGYVPDIKELPESSVPLLQGLDALAMDALGTVPHFTHLTVEENIALMHRLQPKLGLVTHTGHRADYEDLAAGRFPDWPSFLRPAYDGLSVEL